MLRALADPPTVLLRVTVMLWGWVPGSHQPKQTSTSVARRRPTRLTAVHTSEGLVTVSPGGGRVAPTYKEREHSSTVSGMFDFKRSGSAEGPPARQEEARPAQEPEQPEQPLRPPTTSTPTD